MQPLTEREKILVGAFISLLGGYTQAWTKATQHLENAKGERRQAWAEIAAEIRAEMLRAGKQLGDL